MSVVYTNFRLDDISIGMLGLGYSPATGAFNGIKVSVDVQDNHRVHDFIVSSLLPLRHVPARFSLAVSRDESGSGNAGVLAIGGTPHLDDPDVNIISDFVRGPLGAEIDQFIDAGTPEPQQYGITVE